MKLFTRQKRLKSLEEYLGLFYVGDGYPEHKLEDDGYGLVNRILRILKDLEEKEK